MSYILDALRRSQAERERGQVPGLGAQPVTAPSSTAKPGRVPASLWGLLAASVLVLLAAAAVLTTLWTRRAVPAPTLPVTVTGAAPAVVPATVGAAAQPATPGVASAASQVVAAAPAALVLPAQTVPAPAASSPWPIVVSAPAPALAQAPSPALTAKTTTQPALAPETRPAAALPSAQSTAAPARAVAAQAPTPNVPTGDTRPVPFGQLSAEQRRDLPPLQVSGSIWSDNAASRFVMLNGMVVREGDMVAPGLKLERIAQKSAVLRWRELRFEIGL